VMPALRDKRVAVRGAGVARSIERIAIHGFCLVRPDTTWPIAAESGSVTNAPSQGWWMGVAVGGQDLC